MPDENTDAWTKAVRAEAETAFWEEILAACRT